MELQLPMEGPGYITHVLTIVSILHSCLIFLLPYPCFTGSALNGLLALKYLSRGRPLGQLSLSQVVSREVVVSLLT